MIRLLDLVVIVACIVGLAVTGLAPLAVLLVVPLVVAAYAVAWLTLSRWTSARQYVASTSQRRPDPPAPRFFVDRGLASDTSRPSSETRGSTPTSQGQRWPNDSTPTCIALCSVLASQDRSSMWPTPLRCLGAGRVSDRSKVRTEIPVIRSRNSEDN
jgi:hypothetical protein